MVRSTGDTHCLCDPGEAPGDTYLALGILNLSGQPLDHAVELIDLLLGAAQGLPVPDHRGLHLLTLGGSRDSPGLRMQFPTHSDTTDDW